MQRIGATKKPQFHVVSKKHPENPLLSLPRQLDSLIKFSSLLRPILPDGVTVAQQTLNLFVVVQIHVGQPSAIYDFRFSIYDLHQPICNQRQFHRPFCD